MLNWVVWDRTVFTINFVQTKNCVLMLKWIVWNRTVFTFSSVFILDRNKRNRLPLWKKWTQAHLKILIIYLIYLYLKDLALNDIQWLICHKKNKPKQRSMSSNFLTFHTSGGVSSWQVVGLRADMRKSSQHRKIVCLSLLMLNNL